MRISCCRKQANHKGQHCRILFTGNVQKRQIQREKVDAWLSGAGGRGSLTPSLVEVGWRPKGMDRGLGERLTEAPPSLSIL